MTVSRQSAKHLVEDLLHMTIAIQFQHQASQKIDLFFPETYTMFVRKGEFTICTKFKSGNCELHLQSFVN